MCYVWDVASYGAETWALWKVERNTWEVLECGAEEGWRSFGRIV